MTNDPNTGFCVDCLREARATLWNRGQSDCCNAEIAYAKGDNVVEQPVREQDLNEEVFRHMLDQMW